MAIFLEQNNVLSPDILKYHLFPCLDVTNLLNCSKVCKQWNQYANESLVERVAIGKKQWNKLGVNIEDANIPSFPKGRVKWLYDPCDFHPDDKRVYTGVLTLIPKNLTLNKLISLMEL